MATITEYVEFNGVKTSDFNFIASGGDAFNAPARVYEMIDIPGRDGQFALDMGRFENIDVPYHCTNHEPNDMATFRANLDGLRNAFLSARGYQRLEDTFHPDEYRMAVYKSGLEAKMIGQAYASEFDLVFNCKPQRFLKSGETAVSIASGGTISNPTAFESKPLIEVNGYGDMTVNGSEISIIAGAMGNVELAGLTTLNGISPDPLEVNMTVMNNGDTITFKPYVQFRPRYTFNKQLDEWTEGTTTGTLTVNYVDVHIKNHYDASARIETDAGTFTKGTSATKTATINGTLTFTDSTTATLNFTVSIAYDGDSTFTFAMTKTTTGTITGENGSVRVDGISGNSSQSILGNPIYIDCDLGECYKIESGTYVPLNSYIDLGTNPPVLSPGTNTITYDNTYTSVKITPRWWQI